MWSSVLWQCLALGSLLGRAAATPTASHGPRGGDASALIPRQVDFPSLVYTGTPPGTPVKAGTKLRILCIGDSITVGHSSSDGNGYRLRLRQDLSGDQVVFAGTETGGSMTDGYFAAWNGKTIKYMADHIGPSLQHRPNIILVHAGTNDMNANPAVSTEGNEVGAATERLGQLIDQLFLACPDAVVVVAMIIRTCDESQRLRTEQYQVLVPAIVNQRRAAGKHALVANFTSIPTSQLVDCIHPSDSGYRLMGDYWFDFMSQIPKDWINAPVGPDPSRDDSINANGGPDPSIPPPNWGTSPVQVSSADAILDAAVHAIENSALSQCNANPHWYPTGKIALGLGGNGGWHYSHNWQGAGMLASGIGRDPKHVRFHDMNGDGKADYVWLDPDTGMIICWINNLPNPWSPAGTNNSIIGSGAGPAASVFLADMNGDGLEDYMVVDPNNGAVRIWWNYGPETNWWNGWKFVEGGVIATGVPHANWKTLRFPDINGDGRADYVVVGTGGSLRHWMNTGSQGGQDPLFLDWGGIATGASPIDRLVFADIDGDGRDDYLSWDDDAGLSGYLNQPTNSEGVPLYIYQGGAKSIAGGINAPFGEIRLADMDGDGKDDYIRVGDNGAIWVWFNRGGADTTMAMDGLRFADIDGDGLDDYVWLHPTTGAPTVYLNQGPNDADVLGWLWSPLNGGNPIASGAAPAARVQFGDINGDGKKDYLVLDPVTGALTAYINGGADPNWVNGWQWHPIGEIATGLGPGENVRFADIDGDGFDDYIFLKQGGATIIYRNQWNPDPHNLLSHVGPVWSAIPQADASGIGKPPAEISFHDINGDGRADYVWTNPVDGRARVWLNNWPNLPMWLAQPEIASGVGTSGANVRWATLQHTRRASYVAVDPSNGALAAWLNGCDSPAPRPARTPHGGPDTCLLVGYRQGSSTVYYHPGSTQVPPSVYINENSSGFKAFINGNPVFDCEFGRADDCNPLYIGGTWLRAPRTALKWDVFWAPAADAAVNAECWCTVNGREMKGVVSGEVFTTFFYNSQTDKCACEYAC